MLEKKYSDVGVGKGNKASRIRKSTWQCSANLPEPATDLDMFSTSLNDNYLATFELFFNIVAEVKHFDGTVCV